MKIVHFTEKNHQYTSNGVRYESVSGLWKPYFQPFDDQAVSVKKAFKELDTANYEHCKKVLSYDHPDIIEMLKDETSLDINIILTQAQEYRDAWTAKAQKGTDFHNKEERKDIEKGFRINPFTQKKCEIVKWETDKGYENQSYPGKLIDIPDGYVAEHLVKNDEALLAGQLDQNFIETINGVRYVDIDDWKTDETILLRPTFFNRKIGGYQKMQYPIDHIYETNYWKYTMKISTYAKMLEKEGFVVRNLAFTHVVIDDDLNILKETKYKVPYKSFEVDTVLNNRILTLD